MRRGARAGGFTLVEVLAALLVMSVAVVAAVRFSQDSQDSLAMLRNRETAMLLARAKAFELVQDGVNAATDKDGEFEDRSGEFLWEARAHSTGVENYYRLVVRVRWRNPRAGSVKIERLFTD